MCTAAATPERVVVEAEFIMRASPLYPRTSDETQHR
jgi:hypothetical protein